MSRHEASPWSADGFRLLVEALTDPSLVIVDPSGSVVCWNNGAERLLGYRATEVLGQPLEPPLREEPVDRLGWRTRRDGTTFWARIRCLPIRDPAGGVMGYAELTEDLTERREAEQARAEDLASVSHELRTPLNAIIGFSQLLGSTQPPLSERQRECVDRILHAGRYLVDLVSEILELSILDSRGFELAVEPTPLEAVLTECRAMCEPRALERGVAIEVAAALHAVRADRRRLKQVLINLMANAVKYNRQGGRVSVECAEIGERIRIHVRDTGEGLSPSELGQLFQPFNRLRRGDGPEEGAGIGLVVSRRLVERMGGAMGVESEPGVGTVFWIELTSA